MSSKIRLAEHGGYVFVVFAAMTPRQVQIVQYTFKELAPSASQAADIFYSELFRIAPDTRQLFPSDMAQHKGKFVQMLATVVKCLDDVSAISEHVADLGCRHASYDVRESDYEVVGQALLLMLHRVLGTRCTPEVREAWAAAYDMLARVMKEAAAEARPVSAFFSSVIRSVTTAQYGVASSNDDQEKSGRSRLSDPSTRRVRSP